MIEIFTCANKINLIMTYSIMHLCQQPSFQHFQKKLIINLCFVILFQYHIIKHFKGNKQDVLPDVFKFWWKEIKSVNIMDGYTLCCLFYRQSPHNFLIYQYFYIYINIKFIF